MRLSEDAKLFFGGLIGLVGGFYFLWVVVDGYAHGMALNFSRYNSQWFTQIDNPGDFALSVLLHANLSLLAIVSACAAWAKYFVFWPLPKTTLALLVGYLGAVFVLFFACYSIFAIVGLPLISIVGLPIAWAMSHLEPGNFLNGLLPSTENKQRLFVLVHYYGFIGWWFILTPFTYWVLRRKELQ